MTTENPEIEALDPQPTSLALSSGTKIEVERLRTRQLMKLLRILTRGAGDLLGSLSINGETSTEEFAGQLIGAVVISIPEAEDETIAFIQSMVTPAGLVPVRTRGDKEYNAKIGEALYDELQNPELDDLVTIIEQVVTNEADHILALGKRLAVLLRAQRQNSTARHQTSTPSV
jgi:hypothetical protein